VAAAYGAESAQCFQCGTVVSLRKSGHDSGGSGKSFNGGLLAIVLSVIFAVVLLSAGVGVLFLVMDARVESTELPAANDAVTGYPPAAGEVTDGGSSEEPPITATDEERRLAASVSDSVRQQITEMWDAMTATTGKKVMAPRGSVIRNRTEDMLSGIEQREVTRMAALFNLDEAQVRAVIQVHLADAS
jgi:hypothetical protein